MLDRWRASLRRSRARRALERQLDYQRRKAERLDAAETEPRLLQRALAARARVEAVAPLPAAPRVLEVGSGAHGLVFHFGAGQSVGVDPLAHAYASLFPGWQRRVPTLAAAGEDLPFAHGVFDVVLCDNVVDHAAEPARIVAEIARVLRPGGVLYFTVNTHHPVYAGASALHGLWHWAGLPGELAPFASHTVHLTPRAAREMLRGVGGLEVLAERWDREGARRAARTVPPRHAGDRVKRLFYKNALWEAVVRRRDGGSQSA